MIGGCGSVVFDRKIQSKLILGSLSGRKVRKSNLDKIQCGKRTSKTHNLAFLMSRTTLEVPIEMTEIMIVVNKFNLEGRYPE